MTKHLQNTKRPKHLKKTHTDIMPLYLLRINGGGTYRIQSIRQGAQWLDAEWRFFYRTMALSLLAGYSQKETELQMQLQIALND